MVAAILPTPSSNFSIRCAFLTDKRHLSPCLLGNFNSLIFDYLARQSLSGLHLSDYIVQQLPVMSPDGYQEADLQFIVPRVLELTCTSWDMVDFAEDVLQSASKEVKSLTVARRSSLQKTVGDVPQWARSESILTPFPWDDHRRSLIRAELDAYYAHLYGLAESDLRYILNPQDLFGLDYPGETFRILRGALQRRGCLESNEVSEGTGHKQTAEQATSAERVDTTFCPAACNSVGRVVGTRATPPQII